MKMEEGRVVEHVPYASGYRKLVMQAPEIASAVRPGQFVHLRVPRLEVAVLRRPFSVFGTNEGCLSVLFKPVGKGTRAMLDIKAGDTVSLMGPLGNGFPDPNPHKIPLLVAGGYGVAPLSFLASRCENKGAAFIGGATADDILCKDTLEQLGWEVSVTTEDGTMGCRGWVTVALDKWLNDRGRQLNVEMFACGPEGMLKAVGERALQRGCPAWLSLDRRMGCGVGACLACVQKIRQDDGSVRWTRVCREGPVFESRRVVWE